MLIGDSIANGNRIAKKQKAPLPKPSILLIICFVTVLEFQQKNDESDSSDGFSDGDEEDQKDYRVGGYHPVEVFFICMVLIFFYRLEKFFLIVIRYCAKWAGDSIRQCGWFVIWQIPNCLH